MESLQFERPDLLRFEGKPVDLSTVALGGMTSSIDLVDNPAELRARFDRDGYLFLPGLLDSELVIEARQELLLKYAMLGEVDDREPLLDAVAGDRGGLATANLRAFSESLRTGAHYEAVILHERLVSVVGAVLDGPVQPYDFRWPRLARPGEGCGLHCDGPYMSRGTDRHLSTWIPFGSVAPHEGGLMLLEGSTHSQALADGYLKMDADRDGLVWLDDDLLAIQRQYGTRWVTTHYQPGDVLMFSMKMMHGALENCSPEQRCRLSTDSRYLVAGEIADPRWNGENLNPHGPGRVFYPGLGQWQNEDFQDEWKYVDGQGRLLLKGKKE
ncbi:MAG: phytanoyl-CoA dioxygenase family protein [Acidimicrobiales bacterium]